MSALTIRSLQPSDVAATIDMWVAAWQAAYPAIDFSARRDWIAERLTADACIALADACIVGLLVLDPSTRYLDQLVVAAASQRRGVGAGLLAEARRRAPDGLTLHVNQDNTRAIRFYEAHGFVRAGADVNARSGSPTWRMEWRP